MKNIASDLNSVRDYVHSMDTCGKDLGIKYDGSSAPVAVGDRVQIAIDRRDGYVKGNYIIGYVSGYDERRNKIIIASKLVILSSWKYGRDYKEDGVNKIAINGMAVDGVRISAAKTWLSGDVLARFNLNKSYLLYCTTEFMAFTQHPNMNGAIRPYGNSDQPKRMKAYSDALLENLKNKVNAPKKKRFEKTKQVTAPAYDPFYKPTEEEKEARRLKYERKMAKRKATMKKGGKKGKKKK